MPNGAGGGGGGLVGASNSFTGVAQALEIMGDHIYGYSGPVESPVNTETDLINHKTGSFYCTLKVSFSNAEINVTANNIINRIRLNDALIWQQQIDHSLVQYETVEFLNIVVPPYTTLRITAEDKNGSTEQLVIAAGRIYRG